MSAMGRKPTVDLHHNLAPLLSDWTVAYRPKAAIGLILQYRWIGNNIQSAPRRVSFELHKPPFEIYRKRSGGKSCFVHCFLAYRQR